MSVFEFGFECVVDLIIDTDGESGGAHLGSAFVIFGWHRVQVLSELMGFRACQPVLWWRGVVPGIEPHEPCFDLIMGPLGKGDISPLEFVFELGKKVVIDAYGEG